MKLSIIIVNFNTPELTIQAVNSCYKFINKKEFEVIVVDNGSSTGKITEELKNFHNLKLIKSEENIGFGRANNLGFEKSTGEFVFLLNSDAYLIDELSVPLMINYLNENDDVGVVGPNLLKANGSKNYAYGNLLGFRKMISDMGICKIPDNSKSDYATFKACDSKIPKEVGYLAAAGIIIKRHIIEKYGLFDPQFFLYFEDMEMGWRYNKVQIKSVLLPEAIIVHLGGGSIDPSNNFILNEILKSKKYYLKKTQGLFVYSLILILNKLRIITLKLGFLKQKRVQSIRYEKENQRKIN